VHYRYALRTIVFTIALHMNQQKTKFESSKSFLALATSIAFATGCGGSTTSSAAALPCPQAATNAVQAKDLGTFMKVASSSAASGQANQAAQQVLQKLHGHVIPAVAKSSDQGKTDDSQAMSVSVSLMPVNEAKLINDVAAMYTPGSPTFHQFVTPQEFRARYAPSASQVAQVQSFLQAQGLQNITVEDSGFLVHASGSPSAMNAAFNTEIHDYTSSSGKSFHAPAYELQIPGGLAVRGVSGLENLTALHSHAVKQSAKAGSSHAGSGSGGGYAPSDLRTAYNVPETGGGTGQTLAVFELDGYQASDITQYETTYGISNIPLQNVLVDGSTGSDSGASAEVTLDIELEMAMAPNAAKILVYEGPNGGSGILDTYQKIATDNLATSISTSWGSDEGSSGAALIQSEGTVFAQMAAQGQTVFAAAGDSGSSDNGSSLSVDDPSSQPYVVGVGGTTLSTSATQAWQAETTWNESTSAAGGGGISSMWTIPSWQQGVATAANKGSTTMRNTPDVSAHADEQTGYAIYWQGSWSVWGGTSCAAPLWAGFMALVNEQRVKNGLPTIGLASPTLYAFGKSAQYASDFHDISDGSTNGFYPAVTGYDNATGWGSFNGTSLLSDLAADSSVPTVGTAPSVATTGRTSAATSSTGCATN
jgi:kumamolisin